MSGYYQFRSLRNIFKRCLGYYLENVLFKYPKRRAALAERNSPKIKWYVDENGLARPILPHSPKRAEFKINLNIPAEEKPKKKLPPIREDQKTLCGGVGNNWQNRSSRGAAVAACGGLRGGAKRWR